MLKRFLPLMIVAGLISAAILFAGTALIDLVTPAYAYQLPALVAGSRKALNAHAPAVEVGSQVLATPTPAELAAQAGQPTARLSVLTATPVQQAGSRPGTQTNPDPSVPTSSSAPQLVLTTTIADLLAHPDQFANQPVSIIGLVTALDQRRFLLNDGTGQIIITLEDGLRLTWMKNGTTLDVTGFLKLQGDSAEIGACQVQSTNQTQSVGSCPSTQASAPTPESGSHSGSSGNSGSSTSGSNTSGSDSSSSNTSGSNTSGSNSSGSNTSGSNTSGSNNSGSNNSGSNTSGGSNNSGSDHSGSKDGSGKDPSKP